MRMHKEITQLTNLDACASEKIQKHLARLRFATFATDGDIHNALEALSHLGEPPSGLYDTPGNDIRKIFDCIENNHLADSHTKYEGPLSLDKQNDWQKSIQAFFLLKSNKLDEAFTIGRSINHTQMKYETLLPILQYSALLNDTSKAQAIFNELGGADYKIIPIGNPWGATHDQWYGGTLDNKKIYEEGPPGLAYILALQIKDEKTRFMALIAILNKNKVDSPIAGTNCHLPLQDCIHKEAQAIIQAQENVHDKDIMLEMLARAIGGKGEFQKFSELAAQISNPKASRCHFDMCDTLGSGIEGALKHPDCEKNLGLFPSITSDKILFTSKGISNKSIHLATCYKSSGKYQDLLNSGELSIRDKDVYLDFLSQRFFWDHNYDEAIRLAAQISNEDLRRKRLWVFYNNQTSRYTLISSDNKKKRQAALDNINHFIETMQTNPATSHDVGLWAYIVQSLNEGGLNDKAYEIVEKMPDIKKFIVQDQYLKIKVCGLTADIIPDNLPAFEGMTDSEAYTCILDLIAYNHPREAMIIADHHYGRDKMSFRSQIIEKHFSADSLFSQITMDNGTFQDRESAICNIPDVRSLIK